ncbi:DUF58 domain-containing protein [Virgibacillus byunsanensis]|uniref:DUF58 domain-containing protein n=1 Tax=Virgibacillus byunsanensis TaxID=570945 RepID=A0ABW3LPQ9_9BACI
MTVKIKRSIPYPLYYCICEEIFPDTLNKVDNQKDKFRYMGQPEKLKINRKIKKIIFPGFRRDIEMPYYIEQIARGEHVLQAIRIKTGDVFGFVKKEYIFPVEDLVVAYPVERPVKFTERISSFEQGPTSSYSLNLKNTNVATGIREYMPGDKFSWIDWKQTAKKNSMMTKEFEQEKSTDIILILNGINHKGLNVLAFEAAVEITVSLMEVIRKKSSQVGFLSIGEKTVFFPLHHDPTKMEWIRQHLTRVQPSGEYSFPVKLKEEAMKMSGGNIIIVITTNMDEAFRQSIKQVKQRTKQVIVIFIQSNRLITKHEHTIVEQLRYEGVVINVLTEQQLIQNTIEVSVS